ncbi:MAG: hypothetical protein WBG30_05365, partial [Psychrilyobacter sp.]|uniref:hypothetical protein n=1 Tax=Psychrilyobacter sp. TaxID=2586924 RepID=UPI003C75C075
LKKYFEIYQKDKGQKIYEEDKHYSFIEYSGGNITHWDFLDEEGGMASNQISNNIFLIADTDGHKGKTIESTGELTAKAKRLVTLESNLKDGFYALEVKEIENLLTPDIIMKLIREKEKDTDESIAFPEFTQEEYSNIGLGEYITNNLLGGVEKHKKYKADSGTVADKVNFCNIACRHTKNIEHLSKEAKDICEKLYNFIEKANK